MSRTDRIYRWDLDKTYLQTDFDSVSGLVRAAFERAQSKQNVPGSAALLRELRRAVDGVAPRIYFISGSPRQMRRVLEQKLRLDGVQWDGLVLKPNIENLLRIRIRAIKDQIGYKLPALLESRIGAEPPSPEVLFGDDAEWDGYVYSLYADLVAGKVERGDLERTLQLARCYPDARERIHAALREIPPFDAVRRIFINLDRRTPPTHLAAYGHRLVPIYNYFQAALVLGEQGDLSPDAVIRVALEMIRKHNYSVEQLSNSYQELLRRQAITGHIGLEVAEALRAYQPIPGVPSAEEVLHAFERRVRAVPRPERQPLHKVERIDYPTLFLQEQRRHHAFKAQRKMPTLWDS
jgi:hypothetical protein